MSTGRLDVALRNSLRCDTYLITPLLEADWGDKYIKWWYHFEPSRKLKFRLKWISGGGWVQGYKLYLGTNYPPSNFANGEDLGLATEKEIQRITATSDTTIYWRVAPYNENGEATDCPIWSFVIAGSP